MACGSTGGGSPGPDGSVPDASVPDAGQPDAGSGDGGNTDGGDAGLVASFAADATAVALTEVVFDATASTGAASYSWDFGDGEHGGAGKISHAFAQAGSFTVTLTVAGAGGATNSAQHGISISGASHAAAVSVSGLVADVYGPLGGVTVQDIGGSVTTTGADGTVTVSLSTGVAHTLKLSKAGYADQFQPIALDAAATSGYFRAGMMAREPAQNLDAAAGGSLTGKDGASITLPAGAFAGVSGAIQVNMTPIDISGPMLAAFPGKFAGTLADGSVKPIASFGASEFALTQNGQKLQLAPGATATIELPMYATKHLDGTAVAVGEAIALWSLSEGTSQWVQEGTGTVVASSSPSGLSLRAQVTHFSYWNSDQILGEPPYEPEPQCLVDVELPDGGVDQVDVPCTLGAALPNGTTPDRQPPRGLRPLALTDFSGPPGYTVRAQIPAGGGVPVPVPDNLDTVLNACTSNDGGVSCGQLTVNGGKGVRELVKIVLAPVAQAGACGARTDIAPPLDTSFAVASLTQSTCLQFSAPADQVVVLSVGPSANSTLAGVLQLTDPGGKVLGTTRFSPTQSGSFSALLVDAGSYGIEVTATSGAPGSFELSASLDTPQPIAIPSNAVYTTDDVGTKRFSFVAAAGDIIAVTARESCSFPGDCVFTFSLRSLEDPLLDQPIVYQTRDRLTLRPTVAGTYVFELKNDNPQSIDVLVSITKAQKIALGDTVPDLALDASGEILSFAFDALAGQTLVATARSDLQSSSDVIINIPSVRLFDPAGLEIAMAPGGQFFEAGPGTSGATGLARIDVAIAADAIQGATNPNFSLGTSSVAASVPVVETPPVTSVSSSIDGLGTQRYYTVHFTAGQLVRFALHSPDGLGATLTVYTPGPALPSAPPVLTLSVEGFRATSADPIGDSTDVYLVPATGDYTVDVEHAGQTLADATGTFTWSIFDPTPVPLALDLLHPGSLSVPFLFDRYLFSLASPGPAAFFSQLTGPAATVRSRVRDQAGNVVAHPGPNNVEINEQIETLPAGNYTYEIYGVLVTCEPSFCEVPITTYDVTFPSIESPTPIAPGDTISGAIDILGEHDYYQLKLNAGQIYTVNTSSASVFGSLHVYPLNPADFTDDTATDPAAAIGQTYTFSSPTGGTWIIEIDGNGSFTSNSSGAYTISLQ